MGKIKIAVTNTGPLIHLCELQKYNLLPLLIEIILTTQEVKEELLPAQQNLVTPFLAIKELTQHDKNFSKYLIEQFEIHLGEATAIALAKREKIKLFLTDDLTARLIAKRFDIEPHGTIGIILRAFREKHLSKEETIFLIHKVKETTLYITTDLLQQIIHEVEKY